MKKLFCAVVAAMMLVSTAADARGGRGFSGGRSFSRPSAAKIHAPKRSVVKSSSTATTSTSTSGTPYVAPPARSDKRDEDDSTTGGFWSMLFGSAVGSTAGNAAYDTVTDDKKKEAPTPAGKR